MGLSRRRPSDRDRALLFGQLAILLRGGLAPPQALAAVARLAAEGGDGRMAAELLAGMRGGGGLAEAMAAPPVGFGAGPVAMVRAGERAGAVDLPVARLAALAERSVDLRHGLAAAMLTPLLLLGISLAAVAALVSGRAWGLPSLAGLAVAVLLAWHGADQTLRRAWGRAVARLPGLGRWVARRADVRRRCGLAALAEAGTPPTTAQAVLALRARLLSPSQPLSIFASAVVTAGLLTGLLAFV